MEGAGNPAGVAAWESNGTAASNRRLQFRDMMGGLPRPKLIWAGRLDLVFGKLAPLFATNFGSSLQIDSRRFNFFTNTTVRSMSYGPFSMEGRCFPAQRVRRLLRRARLAWLTELRRLFHIDFPLA